LFIFPASYFIYQFYTQPVAIVLPHHDLVATTRQDFLKNIAKKRPFTRHIILLSPDHFGVNQNQLTTSNRDWNLSTGLMKYHNSFSLNLATDDDLLKNDHGIYNPMTDLKTYFPSADIYPVLIGQKVPVAILNSLIINLKSYCKHDCLLVASVDFSHYLPAMLAQVHDAHTINNLQNLDTDKVLQSEVDSPQSLYVLTMFAKLKNANKWDMFDHTNSGIIARDPDSETTTHVFGSYSRGQTTDSNILTYVHLPNIMSRTDNQLTVGDRFFYGVDKFVVDSHVPGFVITQISYPNRTVKSFFPIKDNKFIRGPEKAKLIKNYFDSFGNANITKDHFWGTLIYAN
jgi:AmmeMemoRadiSam system protein B